MLDSKNIFYLRVLVDLYLQTHLETAKDLIYFQRIFYFPEDMLRAWTKHPHRRWQVASVHFKTFNLQTVNLISRNDTLRKVKLSNFLLKNYLSPPFRNSALLGKYKIQTINQGVRERARVFETIIFLKRPDVAVLCAFSGSCCMSATGAPSKALKVHPPAAKH